jgi:hypothetical protein
MGAQQFAYGGAGLDAPTNPIYSAMMENADQKLKDLKEDIDSASGKRKEKLIEQYQMLQMQKGLIGETREEGREKRLLEQYELNKKEAEIKMKQAESQRDPNSQESKSARKFMERMDPVMSKDPDFKNMSYEQITTMYPMSKSALDLEFRRNQELRLERQAELKAQELRNKADKKETDRQHDIRRDLLRDVRATMKDDPRFKKSMEQAMEFSKVNKLLDEVASGNQNALSALGTKLARAMGEVGVLTDTDVVRYVGGQSWGRQMQDWAAKGGKGTLSKNTLKEMASNVGTMRELLNKDTDAVMKNTFERIRTVYPSDVYPDFDDDMVKRVIGFDSGTKQEPEMVRMSTPKGIRLIPKDKVEEAKKQGAKEITNE